MASSYSPDLRIELIANGEKTGTWGTITNLNLGIIIEDAIAGVATVTTSSSAQALTVFNGAQDEARCSTLILNTVAASNYSVYVPPVPKLYVVRNTSATYTCTLYASTISGNTTQAGSGITVPTSTSMLVRCDGVNIVDQTNYVSGALAVGGSFSVAGTATGVTPAGGDNSTKFATTAFVQSAASGSFPSGGIIMWSGAVADIPNIPGGWLLCNGNSNTPNLTDKFIVGAGNSYAVGATGGYLSTALPEHSHELQGDTGSVGDHQHELQKLGSAQAGTDNGGAPISSATGYNTSRNLSPTEGAGGHVHPLSGNTKNAGSNLPADRNLPPYYALCYIMKA
jgi:hypothetical protein